MTVINVSPVRPDDLRLAGLLTAQHARRPEGCPDTTSTAARFLLATRSGRPVGCCGVTPAAPGTAALEHLHVEPTELGRGTARALMAAAERLAARLGAHTVTLDPTADTADLLGTLEAAGYRPVPDGSGHGPVGTRYAKALSATRPGQR